MKNGVLAVDGREGEAANVRGRSEVDFFRVRRVLTYTMEIHAILLDTIAVIGPKQCR